MSAIKPPGGKPPIGPDATSLDGGLDGGPDAASQVHDTGAPDAAATPTGGPGATRPAADPQPTAAAELTPIDALAADVSAGRVAPDAAVDALIERALSDVSGVLSEAQLRDLEATLRALVAEDPTLLALRTAWS